MTRLIRTSADMKAFTKELERLPKSMSKARKRNVLKKGLKPFLNRAIQKAPKDTGDLALSIDYKIFRNNPNMLFAGPITKRRIRIAKGQSEIVDGFYAQWIEYGYRQIAWPKKGDRIRTGRVHPNRIQTIEPRPFIRPAWDETGNKCLETTKKEVTKVLQKEMRKLANG